MRYINLDEIRLTVKDYKLDSKYGIVFLFKQKTADKKHISDWSSDVCSSDLPSLLPTAITGCPCSTRRVIARKAYLPGLSVAPSTNVLRFAVESDCMSHSLFGTLFNPGR